jgi:hypothetical protein
VAERRLTDGHVDPHERIARDEQGSRGRMSWTGNPSTTEAGGRFAAAQVANAVNNDRQNLRAALVVASRSADAADCAEILAMLGLDAGAERRRAR